MFEAIVALSMLTSLTAVSSAAPPAIHGDRATYSLLSSEKGNGSLAVRAITLSVGPGEGGLQWWEIAGVKPDDSTFALRALSERVPMIGASGDIGRVARYMFKDGERPWLEYRQKSSVEGGAAPIVPLLPKFDFRTALLPCPAASSLFEGPFATTGTYLGQGLQLQEYSTSADFAAAGDVKVLTLDPDLIIGTGRVFRDIEEGRVTGRNYEYRPFLPEEYDEMEAAGINFFLTDSAEREALVRERPVFYNKHPEAADFPNMFYRGNYNGCVMFIDEPAALTNFGICNRVSDASNLLRLDVINAFSSDGHYGSRLLAARLKSAGIHLGIWDLVEREIPSWETLYQTAYYQVEAAASAVVHEGRYNLDAYNAELQTVLGPEAEVTAEQMLKLHYAFLRGAARCFDKSWGMSIYGQCDPKLSPLAMSMAYDAGTRYIWFWTSDLDHHMPYSEQLELTRLLRAHEQANPRPPMDLLLNDARIAIAYPEGYSFWPGWLWWSHRFTAESLNEEGVAHRDVVAAGMREAVRLAKQGIEFDIVIDGEPVKNAGYERIITVRRDGTLSTAP